MVIFPVLKSIFRGVRILHCFSKSLPFCDEYSLNLLSFLRILIDDACSNGQIYVEKNKG